MNNILIHILPFVIVVLTYPETVGGQRQYGVFRKSSSNDIGNTLSSTQLVSAQRSFERLSRRDGIKLNYEVIEEVDEKVGDGATPVKLPYRGQGTSEKLRPDLFPDEEAALKAEKKKSESNKRKKDDASNERKSEDAGKSSSNNGRPSRPKNGIIEGSRGGFGNYDKGQANPDAWGGRPTWHGPPNRHGAWPPRSHHGDHPDYHRGGPLGGYHWSPHGEAHFDRGHFRGRW